MSQVLAKKRIGIALRRLLSGEPSPSKYFEVFGCGPIFMGGFIGHQLQGGMSWENFRTAWKVGHVLPLFEFDQEDEAWLTGAIIADAL